MRCIRLRTSPAITFASAARYEDGAKGIELTDRPEPEDTAERRENHASPILSNSPT